MKKSLFLILGFLALTFPILAQELVPEEMPNEILTLKKGNIPAPVIKAAEQLFEGNSQIAWGVFPYELKNYGWVVNSEYNEPIDHYEIQFKGKDGSDIFAVFESTGELISSRIIHKNAPVPPAIMKSIENSEYKDWEIASDLILIKNTQKKVVEHYAVKLTKVNMKKTLYFTTKGDVLINK
ncbi:MAG: hypothetical protein NT092_01005 [Bacteroidia bacterium]|nr:hypothetical protein [Bacteroidia bacterium]